MDRTEAVSFIRQLSKELGIAEPAPTRFTNKPAPATSMNIVAAIVGGHGDGTQTDKSSRVREIRRLAETGAASAHELRDQLRAIGIDLGHTRQDAEDRESTAKHECGHAAAGLALGWKVGFIDLSAGQCQVLPPSLEKRWMTITERDAERAVIATAGAVFAGTGSWRSENESDRVIVQQHRTRWEDARAEAELMAKDRRVKSLHGALTEALLAAPSGRLEGASLRAVIAEWEGE